MSRNHAADLAPRSAFSIANRLLELAEESGRTLTPMQLIKLVYLCHGWMLGLYGRPLIRDQVQAWAYGPVISDLYDSVRQFRSGPVQRPIGPQQTAGSLDDTQEDLVGRFMKCTAT